MCAYDILSDNYRQHGAIQQRNVPSKVAVSCKVSVDSSAVNLHLQAATRVQQSKSTKSTSPTPFASVYLDLLPSCAQFKAYNTWLSCNIIYAAQYPAGHLVIDKM